MSETISLKRRRFLQCAGIGAFAAAAAPRLLFAEATGGRFVRQPSSDFHPDVEIEITATVTTAPILPGKPTTVWKYDGKLLKGPDGAVRQLPGSHLGPTLTFEKGQKVRIYFKNDLPEPNIIHWHGLHVPQVMDGHPMYDVSPGSGYIYEYEVTNRAGTYFYHAHTHEMTGRQVYYGLGGLLVVHDPEEKALNLPSGDYDLPVVLQDRNFDSDNQLRYVQGMGDRHMGILGDEILVNGLRHFVLPVATRAYRLRLVNASNSRIYKLGWEDGTALTIIGTDGGLLEKPVTRPYVMLGAGERVDVWADFSGRKVGSEMVMKSLPFSGAMPGHGEGGGGMMGMMGHGGEERGPSGRAPAGGEGGEHAMMGHGGEGRGPGGDRDEGGHGMMGMMGRGGEGGRGMMGMMGQGGEGRGPGARGGAGEEGAEGHGGMGMMHASKLPLGSAYPVFKVHIMREEPNSHSLPERLAKIERYQRSQAENPDQPRSFKLSMAVMKWLINGKEFEMKAAAPEETVKTDTLQVIEFDNGYSGGHGMGGMGMGMMMGMAHPMHIHGQQFQIIERVVREDVRRNYETVSKGHVDEGWKDVVLVMPGEKVTLLKRFDHFKGLYLVHCHNLEHESMGMMRNFNVV